MKHGKIKRGMGKGGGELKCEVKGSGWEGQGKRKMGTKERIGGKRVGEGVNNRKRKGLGGGGRKIGRKRFWVS